MSNLVGTTPTPNTPSPTHYLRKHLTAPHIPPDCPPAVITPTYCGELSGAITGDVYSFGYLTLGNQLVYLNMGGPRMAVEAIRSRLSRGEMIHLTPDDAPAVEFTVTGMGKFEDYTENMSSHHFQNTMLIHRNIAPNYNEADKLTFALILAQSPKQLYSAFHQHLHQLLGIAVFPHWIPTLWATGLSAQFIEKCDGAGAVGYGVYLKASDWESMIAIGVSTGALPLSETGDESQTVTILDVKSLELPDDEPESASSDQSYGDPLYLLLKYKLPSADNKILSDLTTALYPILRKHAIEGWNSKSSLQLEMHMAVYEFLRFRLEGYTRDELSHIANAIVTLSKTLDLHLLLITPPSMDTEGKRALYRFFQDEEIATKIHDDIMGNAKHGWRDNTLKERGMLNIISRHVDDAELVNKVFWVIKTQGEY